MEIVLATPTGPVTLTMQEYQAQNVLVEAALRRMGGPLGRARNGNERVRDYVAMFGLLQPTREHMFGESVWHGMLTLLSRYVHAGRYLGQGGQVYVGWFLCPQPFGRDRAMEPATGQDTQYYPATFVIWHDCVVARMACEAILLQNARPWWIHLTRMCSRRSLDDVRRALFE